MSWRGHVPARDIRRLLKERPKIAGLAVPSMPAGSPGMEVPGRKVQPYRVLTFDKNGASSVYASYGGAPRSREQGGSGRSVRSSSVHSPFDVNPHPPSDHDVNAALSCDRKRVRRSNF